MKKKLLTLVLTAAMTLTFAACGSNGREPADSGNSSAAQSSTPSVDPSASAEPNSQADDGAMTLADWIASDEAKTAEDYANTQIASSGMSLKLAADGNMLVYEYYLDAGMDIPQAEALDALFGPVIEGYKSTLDSLFSSFESAYNLKLDGARFSFFDSEGNEIYSGEVLNEN